VFKRGNELRRDVLQTLALRRGGVSRDLAVQTADQGRLSGDCSSNVLAEEVSSAGTTADTPVMPP